MLCFPTPVSAPFRPSDTRPAAARRVVAMVLAISLAAPAWAQPSAGSGLVSTERVAAAALPPAVERSGDSARASLLAALDRAEVSSALVRKGLSVDAARERVAALTDDEALTLAQRIDEAPAGAGEIISTIVFVFVLLLVTDILGFTKIFPFTRAIR